MIAVDNVENDLSPGPVGRDGLFWTASTLSILTGLLAALVAVRLTFVMFDRHFHLDTSLEGLWDAVVAVVNSQAFAVLYLVVPVAWVVVVGWWWWTTRDATLSRLNALVVVLVIAAALFGAAGWFASAVDQVRWAFGLDVIPDALTTFGIGDSDRREPLLVVSLGSLIVVVLVNLWLMLRFTSVRAVAPAAPIDDSRTQGSQRP